MTIREAAEVTEVTEAAEAEVERLKAELEGWRVHALAVERENVKQRVFLVEAAAEVHRARVRIEELSSRLEEVRADHDRLAADAVRVHAEAARLAGLRVFRYTASLRSLYGRVLRQWRRR